MATDHQQLDPMERAERSIRRYAAHLAEHPRCAWTEVSRYPPHRQSARASIHISVAFSDDGSAVVGIDHAALCQRVAEETGLLVDPEYTGVFRWARRNVVVYWWDWRRANEGMD